MEIYPVDIIISIINIIVLFLLLRVLLWKYVIKYLNDRSERVRSEIDSAEDARKRAEALENDYKLKIKHIHEQGQDIIRDSRAIAEEEAEAVKRETKEKVDEMLREARFHIEAEREQSIKDAQAEIVELAAEMASSILKREVSSTDNTRAVDDFFEDLK